MDLVKAAERRVSRRRWFDIEPSAPERMQLEAAPLAGTVASFVFTRAAERSWEVLNQHLEEAEGGVFWIGGPAGCGKTHFLNYVIALQRRAGAVDAQNMRRLVCGLELAGRLSAGEVELFLLSAMAEQIGGDPRTSGDLFRHMRGAAALNVGLEAARRTGVAAIMVAIDFGTSDCAVADFFVMLGQVAASFQQVKLTVIAAGRAIAPEASRPLAVVSRDALEEGTVAVRRARRLVEGTEIEIDAMYAGIDTAGCAPGSIFPFHPMALNALGTIASYPRPDRQTADAASIVTLSRLVREVLASPGLPDAGGLPIRLIYPSDLTLNTEVANLVKASMADAGRAAWKIARDRTAELDSYESDLAREIIDTLIVEMVCGGTDALTLEELQARVPLLTCMRGAREWTAAALRDLLQRLEMSTGGVISVGQGEARFDPNAAGAPELAAFNAALMLARRFDPRLTIARDRAALAARLARLDDAMAQAVEAAVGTRTAHESALKEAKLEMPAANRATIAQYIALAESGAAAMIAAAADEQYLAAAIQSANAYEVLAAAASSMPQLRAMRDYLAETGLRALPDEAGPRENEWQHSTIVSLETECELLRVELGPRILTGTPRNLDALEARFQKFKWTYVQCYIGAHSRWVEKMERLKREADDARRYYNALAWLNAIAALGRPEGVHLGAVVAELSARVVRCGLGEAIAPETIPRCTSCGFQLGASSPEAEIENAMEAIRRALEIKLASLSHSMIARLIRSHDKENRLEGFLKITQAAQTDALVRVLDEGLAKYLARVLEEE